MNQQTYWSLLRTDLYAFIDRAFLSLHPGAVFLPNWHVQAIAWYLQQCITGKINRLIITMPPRSLKSHCASVAFPAWVLGNDPTKKIICVSYASELSNKFSRECRCLLEESWYRECFRNTCLNPRKCTEQEIETTQHGFRFSTSLGGTLTGRGGNIIIIDDPLKPSEAESETKRNYCNEWFDGTLLSRLDHKERDVILIVMQRVHEEDLVGHVKASSSDWHHLDLPAIAQEREKIQLSDQHYYVRNVNGPLHGQRESLTMLEKIKNQIGTRSFNTQYLQRPVPAAGNLVKREWFQEYTHVAHNNGRIVQSWDTASKSGELNNYSVCTTWLIWDGRFYLLDVVRARWDYPQLCKQMIQLKKQWGAHTVLIEDKGSGIQLIQDLRYHHRIYPVAIRPEQDKITRMSNQTANIEAGQVFLPKEASWLGDFYNEMLAFPLGKYDDQVDSVSQFLSWTDKYRKGKIISKILPGAY